MMSMVCEYYGYVILQRSASSSRGSHWTCAWTSSTSGTAKIHVSKSRQAAKRFWWGTAHCSCCYC